jgi:gliding motility-associated peptidyl-prolyl isomerase
MKKLTIILITLASFYSCKEPKARKSLIKKTGNSREYSVNADRTKKQLQLENKVINLYTNNDSTSTYLNSNKGFKYSYILKDTLKKNTPKYGDALLYSYYVTDIKNNIIYRKEDIGLKSYYVDQENNITEGFRQALKIIKVGEEIKFIFPSQLAYGYRGDGKNIKPNLPIICYIELKELVNKNQLQIIKQ